MPYKFKVFKILLCGLLFLTPLVSLQAQDVDDVSRIRRVVIDAGHGGKDPGAISRNGKYKEKNITLSVALGLGELIKSNFPDIKVIYTRSTDKYVELSERAAIANRNKADLFISIHVNSAKSTQARGTETFVMGTHKSEANFEVCKLENSVIVIEEDYEKKYEGFNPGSPESYIIFSLLQNVHQEQSIKYAAQVQGQFARGPISVNRGVKQGGLLVLWKTTMPAVLTELGFISNPKDCAVLVTKKGQEQFARGLFNAFVAYKKDFEKTRREEGSGRNVAEAEKAAPVQKSAPEAQKAPAQGPVAAPKAVDEFYAVQILSVGKVLGKNAYDLKGRKDTHYIKAGNLYKYYVGRYASRKEAAAALPGIRKSFPGAFVIHIKDNVIIQ
ncbi:MAG: N-acetylmuramoyl-L-alanine amidase [Bacteroidales bacterium]|nr:N-acetylmuramoyl-L-alanine amidase [Bacteroidales bacterium]